MLNKIFSMTLLLALLVGCGDKDKPGPAPVPVSEQSVLPAGMLLAKAPEGAQDIVTVKPGAKEGDTIVFRGQIGGSKQPFVKGRAVMLVADLSLRN